MDQNIILKNIHVIPKKTRKGNREKRQNEQTEKIIKWHT